MEDEEQYITPIHVRDYIFCPTIFYYKHVIGVAEPVTESMQEGIREFSRDLERYEERKTLLNKKRIAVERMIFGLEVLSRKYRVKGIVDTIYWSGRKLHVLEIKNTESGRLFPDHLYQTSVYALMVEEEFKEPVYKIAVFYKKSDKWFEKRFTSQLRNYTIKLIEKIHEVLDSGEIPEPRMGSKCKSCFYSKFCGK